MVQRQSPKKRQASFPLLRFLMGMVLLLGGSLMPAFAQAEPSGFSGWLEGEVKWSQEDHWFTVIQVESATPLPGSADDGSRFVGTKTQVKVNWKGPGKPEPEDQTYLRTLGPGTKVRLAVTNPKGDLLRLDLTTTQSGSSQPEPPQSSPQVKKDTTSAPSPVEVKKYNREDITGAQIDESKVKRTLTVDPARADGESILASLTEAFNKAYESLVAGDGVKIIIQPGTYREAIPKLDWTKGQAANTLLVVEGTAPGQVVWSGSDLFPPSEWQPLGGDLYAHSWDHEFGNFTPTWGAKLAIGHRSEMLFIDGKPLQQVLLEEYDYDSKAEARAHH
jgi:hypothetical protein